MNKKERFFIIIVIFFAKTLFCGEVFACNANQKGEPVRAELKTATITNRNHGNERDILGGADNPAQYASIRLTKLHHYVKILFIELSSATVCLRYLKTNLKAIYSRHVQFLKLLLYPEHVFW